MKVKVHALFSHNQMIGSKIIALGSKHLAKGYPRTSHVALLINERWVHEATGYGVNVMSIDRWRELHTEVGRVELESREYQEIADQFRLIKGKKYDYPGVLYLGLCVIPTFVGLPLPRKNLLQSDDKYFCCEVLGFLTNKDYSMACPVQILKTLTEGNKNG